MEARGGRFVNVIHPTAHVGPHVRFGVRCIVCRARLPFGRFRDAFSVVLMRWLARGCCHSRHSRESHGSRQSGAPLDLI